MITRRFDAAVVVALVTIAVAFWKFRVLDPAVVPLELFGNADFYLQIYPMAARAAASLREGSLPLWNPFQYAGHPFLATGLYGVLYPFNAFHLFLPTAWAIEVIQIFHLALAGVLTYAFARTVALSAIASLVAAITYMLSGFVLSQAVWFPPALAAATWLPLALLAVERIAERRTVAWAAVLALATALTFLAGWVQTALYATYVMAAYAFCRLVVLAARERTPRRAAHAALLIGAATAAGLAMAAAQILPSAELQALGPRRAGVLDLAQVMPFGPMTADRLMLEMTTVADPQPRAAYLGLTALVLLAVALPFGRPRWRVACFAGLAALALGTSFGSRVALAVYQALPGTLWFRLPARVLVVYAFSGAMLAAIGTDALARAPRPVAGAVAAAVALALLAFGSLGGGLGRVGMAYLAAAASLACLAAVVRGRGRRLALVGLAALTLLDLGTSVRNRYLHPIHNPETFDRNAAVLAYVKEHQGLDRTYIVPPPLRRGRYTLDLFAGYMAKQGSLRGIYSITDYEPLSLTRYRDLYEQLETPEERLPRHLPFTGSLRADPARPQLRLLDLLSMRFVVVSTRDDATMRGLLRRAAEWRVVPLPVHGESILFERIDVLPRAYVAHDGLEARDPDDALRAVTDPSFDPRRLVVLEGVPATAPTDAAITPARITLYEPNRVVIETEPSTAGWLVLTDTFYPGWRASIDGTATSIVRANYLFRAVPLGPGPHVVTFDYVPASFRLGTAVSLATLALLVVAFVFERRARQRRPRAATTSTAAISAPTT